MHLTRKIAIATGALTLTATGIAAAGSAPDAAENGLTKAEEQVGVELPAAKSAHPGTPHEKAEADDDESDAPEETEAEAESSEAKGTGSADNHGAMVSAVAHTELATGREHGEAVSAAAHQNHGAEMQAAKEHPEHGGGNDGEHGKP